MKRLMAVFLMGAMVVGASAGLLYAHGVELKARMNGEKSQPGDGDPNGTGVAKIEVNDEAGEACFTVRFHNIGKPFAAHIHKGAPGTAGDAVVTLWDGPKKTSPAKGCVDVRAGLAEKIQNNPRRYYVNLHTEDFPDGAIRGQLKNAG